MNTRRLSRRLVAGVGLMTALSVVPVTSATAARTTPSALAEFGAVQCAATVTYTWSGFKGGKLTPQLLVTVDGTSSMTWTSSTSGSGSSGTATHTFQLQSTYSAAYLTVGTGRLLKPNGSVVADSESTSVSSWMQCQVPPS